MLLSIFVFLVCFSLVLLIAGYYVQAPVGQISGCAVLFVTGLLLMFSSVQYPIGENFEEYYVYGDNFTGYHWDYDDPPSFNPSQDGIIFLFHTVHNGTTVYASWDEETALGINTRHTVAFLLLVTSILLFVSVLSQLREGLGDE